MDELLLRLRVHAYSKDRQDAADEIERLREGIQQRPSRDDVRTQTRAALEDVGEPFSTAQVNRVANAVMLLLAGEPKYEVDQGYELRPNRDLLDQHDDKGD